MKQYTSLLEPLQYQNAHQPDRVMLTFLNDDQRPTEHTSHQIWQETQAYAAALSAHGIQPGELVILVLPQTLDLVYSFLGAVYMGAIPSVFAFFTPRMDAEIYRQRVQALVKQSKAKCVITFSDIQADMQAMLNDFDCQVIDIETVKQNNTLAEMPLSSRSGNDIVYIQYSSGTTGLQKGVAITHEMILEQIVALSKVVNLQPDDIQVNWLPLNHDMGLMAGLLLPMLFGIPTVLMSPFTWVRFPALLFWVIDKYKATHCYMPNFAYSHCALNIRKRDMEGLDISHMRMFMNGGEPIHKATLDSFVERFSLYGLKPEMISAGYGLAEVSGAISTTPSGEFPRIDWIDNEEMSLHKIAKPVREDNDHKMSIVSCGKLTPAAKVRIIDADGNDLSERYVGEVLISGTFTFEGYFQEGDVQESNLIDGWLPTGDLGYLADNELYICGRKKDMMIIGGANFFPEYLELAVLHVPELRPGRTVVFGVKDPKLGTEMAVMICELKQELPEDEHRRIIREIRRLVVQATDITLGDIRLVERGWIHKTSSGKFSRNLNRDKYIKEFRN